MPDRKESARLADHAQIEGLADDLLPALIAKLGASGLAELEVHEGDWKVRLRRPADGSGGAPRAARAEGRPEPARPMPITATPITAGAEPAGGEPARGPVPDGRDLACRWGSITPRPR